MGYTLYLSRAYTYMLRRRSALLKVVFLLCTVWLTVAFLLFVEQRNSSTNIQNQFDEAGVALGLVGGVDNGDGLLKSGARNGGPNSQNGGGGPAGQVLRAPQSLQKQSSASNNNVIVIAGKHSGAEVPGPQNGIGGVLVPPRSNGDHSNMAPNYGELGKPVVLPTNMTPEVKKLVDEGWQKNAFNQYVSDLISLHRQLPDPRDEWCKAPNRTLTKLPSTSVVICFHNEAWSVLLRTVHSVLDRSPKHLLHEIILVDDYSDMPHLKKQLEEYMEMYPKVKIVRATKREGLIRARLLGARYATAPVLTYLDSHCECAEGWLEPLLDRIARDPTTVVCPVIDVIDDNTLEYHWRDSGGVNVGGFDWNLQFNWHAVPEREKKRHQNSAEPVFSPTMAGGLFSIDKQFFEKLGTYDSGFDIWGGENLELSFKTWMCGGTLEIVPCSHVGHIFRKRSPYKWRSGVNVLKRNSIRLAEVWMDEYAKYYYQRVGNDLGEYGDVSSRKELRRKLGCKSFKWYLDNVYPELFVPGEAVASGEISNRATNMCVDSACKPEDLHKPVGLWPCHSQGGNQYWMLSRTGEIRRDEACLDYAGQDVILYPCHGSKGNQFWQYKPDTKLIQHGSSKKCLAISDDKQKLLMEECNSGSQRQQWKFENYDAAKL